VGKHLYICVTLWHWAKEMTVRKRLNLLLPIHQQTRRNVCIRLCGRVEQQGDVCENHIDPLWLVPSPSACSKHLGSGLQSHRWPNTSKTENQGNNTEWARYIFSRHSVFRNVAEMTVKRICTCFWNSINLSGAPLEPGKQYYISFALEASFAGLVLTEQWGLKSVGILKQQGRNERYDWVAWEVKKAIPRQSWSELLMNADRFFISLSIHGTYLA